MSQSDTGTDMYTRVLNQNGSLYTKGSGGIIGLIILGLFIICFVYYCFYEICRFYWCPSSASEDSAVLVTDGFTFTLTAEQRRDVLEAIFSDTSKSVTKSMFFTKKSNLKTVTAGRDEKDVNAFTPGTALEDDCSVDLEANATGGALYDDYMPPSSFGEPTDAHATPDGLESEVGVDSSCTTLPSDQTLSEGSDEGISEKESVETATTELTEAGKTQTTQDDDLPVLGEVSKEEEEEEEEAALPNNVTSSSSIKSDHESDGEESDEDENLCAICLSGYVEGEVVISSKYCKHLFHKECILAWLEKKDECPCCRVDMVTSGDISKATAELVGKTRMIRAVESIRVRPPSTTPSPSSS